MGQGHYELESGSVQAAHVGLVDAADTLVASVNRMLHETDQVMGKGWIGQGATAYAKVSNAMRLDLDNLIKQVNEIAEKVQTAGQRHVAQDTEVHGNFGRVNP